MTKTCRDCMLTKSVAEFPVRKDSPDGYRNSCSACRRAYLRGWHDAHPGYATEQSRQWITEHPERKREISREWKAANPDKVRAGWERYYEANHEAILERGRQWRAANRETQRAAEDRWEAAHPGHKLGRWHTRRARLRAAFVEHVDRFLVWERDHGLCGICGEPAAHEDWHLDHVVPLAAGGEHSYANVQVSHPFCNMSKHARVA